MYYVQTAVSTDIIPPIFCQCHVRSETTSADPSFLPLINLMDCESKVNDFPPTTEDALAFTIRHRLQSILRTEITASIIGRRHPQNNGNTGGTMIDSNWILFRNPGREKEQVEARCHRFTAFPNKKH